MRTLTVAALAISLTGCATLFGTDAKTVTVNSATPGAQVLVDGQPMGYTPTAVTLDAHKDHSIVVRSARGETGCRLVTSVGAGWVILDILAGFIPVVIDAATGAWATIDGTPCYGAV
jgi:hypothetical protein